jgi:hypothetical protein
MVGGTCGSELRCHGWVRVNETLGEGGVQIVNMVLTQLIDHKPESRKSKVHRVRLFKSNCKRSVESNPCSSPPRVCRVQNGIIECLLSEVTHAAPRSAHMVRTIQDLVVPRRIGCIGGNLVAATSDIALYYASSDYSFRMAKSVR